MTRGTIAKKVYQEKKRISWATDRVNSWMNFYTQKNPHLKTEHWEQMDPQRMTVLIKKWDHMLTPTNQEHAERILQTIKDRTIESKKET